MHTLFEATVKLNRENDEGLVKTVTEKYIVEGANHTDAETTITAALSSVAAGFQLKRLVPSGLSTVLFDSDMDKFHKCKLVYMGADSNGKVRKITEVYLIESNDIQQAYDKMNEALVGAVVSYSIDAIAVSPIQEVFLITPAA
jgi:hypothetical protein